MSQQRGTNRISVGAMSTIRLATHADIARAARTACRAFADDPVMRWLFPDDDEYEKDHQQMFGGIIRRWLATDSLYCTDDVTAMAGWVPPGRPEFAADDSEPVSEHPEWRRNRFAAIGEAMEANTPAEPHWYLNMLATHPDWQRQGLGAALMQTVFEIAGDQGLPCYLETETLENVAYYRHHGFEVQSEWHLADGGPHMWGMFRPIR